MDKANHQCRVCKTMYYACNDCHDVKTFTPWRLVCCSPKCYQEYLKQVFEARGLNVVQDAIIEEAKIQDIKELTSKSKVIKKDN